MRMENKRVDELDDEKVYLFKNNGLTSELKGITIKGIFKADQELLVSEVEERKVPLPSYYDRVKQMIRRNR